jgi:AraC family transcriptional regulator of adaptative response/methylated-DNA-[protein]-cysteine methyltransferase
MRSVRGAQARQRRKNRVGTPAPPWQYPAMNEYERIARVIRHLESHRTEQPDLSSLANVAGLSPSHFHRLFSVWAGITPKDFLQCLTLAHARALLQKGASVLDAALASGLSGPGRLHDLCIILEAATPGEVKSGGAGWALGAGFADSPFGRCLIGGSTRGLCHLSFHDENDAAALAALHAHWPGARLRRDDAYAERLAGEIFATPGDRSARPALRAFVQGTQFQVRVWRALLQVPPGALVSYGRLAAAIDEPGAARAVGAAVGRNPLAYLIPCHRVIRETGVIGEYHWGAVRKRAMVAWECAARGTGEA